MARNLVITILTDKSSWMNKYDRYLEACLIGDGHIVNRVTSREDILNGDIAFLLSCFEILRPELLARNKHNIVVHASALPQGKGWSPTTWQILEGKCDIPLTLFEATPSVDAGQIYCSDLIHLDGFELIDEWQDKLGSKIVEMCCSFVRKLARGEVSGVEQTGVESYYRRRRPEDSRLDIDKSISDQFNLFRVVDNERYPAYFEKDGHKYTLKIYRADNV